jgi:hypothetical protein
MKPRSWIPHVALLATAAVMVVVAAAKHTSTEEALRIAFDGEASTDERLWAAHLAANRATTREPRLGDALVRSFLAADDERLREGALTIDLSRHAIHPPGTRPDAAPPLQSAYVYAALEDGEYTPHRVRSRVLFRRKVGGSSVGGIRRMALPEARWFMDSLRGTPLPPRKEIDRYLIERSREPVNLRRPR